MTTDGGAVPAPATGAGSVADPVLDLLVVGGGPAGLGVARGYREAGGQGTVLLVSADVHAPYARPPLTKEYLRGESEADELPLAPDSWYAEQRVGLRLGTRVTAVLPGAGEVRLADGTALGYRSLALATGSAPTPLPVPGGDSAGLVYVRDRHSGEALRAIAEGRGTAVVIGSGFIGCEVAASLARRDVSVVLVTDEELPHAARLGSAVGERIRGWLEDEGVDLVLGDGVASLAQVEDGWRVELVSGRTLVADAIVSGSGARPDLGLAESAGLRTENGGIATDETLQTSEPRIWAAGDVASAHHPAAGRALRVEHWGEAETMGEIAGANIARRGGPEEPRRWEQAPGFWSGIGDHVLKYSAWGDGYDDAVFVPGADGWAVWYVRDSVVVGVLTCDWDDVYESGQRLIERGAQASEVMST